MRAMMPVQVLLERLRILGIGAAETAGVDGIVFDQVHLGVHIARILHQLLRVLAKRICLVAEQGWPWKVTSLPVVRV